MKLNFTFAVASHTLIQINDLTFLFLKSGPFPNVECGRKMASLLFHLNNVKKSWCKSAYYSWNKVL